MRHLRFGVLHLLGVIFVTAILGGAAAAQSESKPKRLRAPATVRGLVGGEANDTYVVHVQKGRLLTVQLSWRNEDNNTASFSVGNSPTLEPVAFGQESNAGRKWMGRIPRTGDYFIEVVAHPAAHYTLKILLK